MTLEMTFFIDHVINIPKSVVRAILVEKVPVLDSPAPIIWNCSEALEFMDSVVWLIFCSYDIEGHSMDWTRIHTDLSISILR